MYDRTWRRRRIARLAMPVLLLGLIALEPAAAAAGKADVVAVRLAKEPSGTWRIDVTVKSDDKGWHKYAQGDRSKTRRFASCGIPRP